MSADELEFKRKFIDFKHHEWPETNPLELNLPSYKGQSEVRIQNYRYPAFGDRKGIVQLIHGHGDYIGRYAYLAEQIAMEGYDVIGIDQRGFGRSEGQRGILESREIIRDDIIEYTTRIN